MVERNELLKKELNLWNIYALATGSTLSSGFFLLPGLAAAQAGSALVFAYLIAALPLIPGIFSLTELATAMPRAGGVYYFLDRSLGPLVGTIGGLGTWAVMILKSVFALVGVGAYLGLFFPDLPMVPVACAFAMLFGVVNLYGAKKTGALQAVLVVLLLVIVTGFVAVGLTEIKAAHFSDMLQTTPGTVFSTAGLLCVSYIGLTKVASVAEEVKDPERNLPLGVFLALGTAILVYGLGSFVMVGLVPRSQLDGNLTPAATAADIVLGRPGAVFITIAAVFAFFSVANAGILSASRYPMAMSRDNLMPPFFRRVSARGAPRNSILVTVGVIVLILATLGPSNIAKLASTFQLLTFAFACLAVIVMRESHIESYDPGYRSPFYPWLHLAGIVGPFAFMFQMGPMQLVFAAGLIAIGVIWYRTYAREKVERGGAIYHIFARLGEKRYEGLDLELRGILREKGLREEDPFDDMIARALVLDLDRDTDFETIVAKVSEVLAARTEATAPELYSKFLDGARNGATPITRGVALPHVRLGDLEAPEMVLVRSRFGVRIELIKEFWGEDVPDEPVYALMFLAGTEHNPRQHLRILAQIAEFIDHENFILLWRSAANEQDLKETLLREEHFLSVRLAGPNVRELVGRELRHIRWPSGALVAMIHRENQMIIPHGDTVLQKFDRLTIIGEPRDIRRIKQMYGLH